jgi:hypothetical protein
MGYRQPGGYGYMAAFLVAGTLAWSAGALWYARRHGRWRSALSPRLFTRLLPGRHTCNSRPSRSRAIHARSNRRRSRQALRIQPRPPRLSERHRRPSRAASLRRRIAAAFSSHTSPSLRGMTIVLFTLQWRSERLPTRLLAGAVVLATPCRADSGQPM